MRGAIDELDIVDNLNIEELANSMKCPTRVEICSCIDADFKEIAIIDGYR